MTNWRPFGSIAGTIGDPCQRSHPPSAEPRTPSEPSTCPFCWRLATSSGATPTNPTTPFRPTALRARTPNASQSELPTTLAPRASGIDEEWPSPRTAAPSSALSQSASIANRVTMFSPASIPSRALARGPIFMVPAPCRSVNWVWCGAGTEWGRDVDVGTQCANCAGDIGRSG